MQTAIAPVVSEEFRQIPLDTIVESKTNPRRRWNQKTLDELTDSVAQVGVVQPIVVRRSQAAGRPDVFEIVAGARRFRASKAAKRETIPAIVRDLSDDQVLEIQTIENLQREDVHPLDEALGYQALIDRAGYDVEGIATKVGKSPSYIYQRLKLADLIEPVQKAFLEEKITAGHAVQIARLEPVAQKEALRVCVPVNKWNDPYSIRELANWIEEEIHRDLSGAPFDPKDATLLSKAGPCTTCPKRSGAQPDLFSDIKKKDTCTDRSCFKAKIEADVARRKAALTAQGEKVVEISTKSYRHDARHGEVPKSALLAGDYRAASKETCEHTKTGLYVDGDKRGEALKVCTDPNCKIHKSQSAYPRSAPRKKTGAEKARDLRIRAEKLAEDRAIQQILARVRRIGPKEIKIIRDGLLDRLLTDAAAVICKRRGWDSERGYTANHTLEKKVPTMQGPELAQLLVEMAIGHSSYSGQLDEAIKIYGINRAKLYGAALAELTLKATAKKIRVDALHTRAKSKAKKKAA
jgi:ParB family chromosome partitioning protein